MTVTLAKKSSSTYTDGLRELADLIDMHGLTGRMSGDNPFSPLHVHVDTKGETAAWARALAGAKKRPADGSDNMLIEGSAGALRVTVWVQREEVCERVVTGTREVRRLVPAPNAPMVEVTETVEDVEWVCAPLLAAEDSPA